MSRVQTKMAGGVASDNIASEPPIARHWKTVFSFPDMRAPNGSPRPSMRLRRACTISSRTMMVVTIQGMSPESGSGSRWISAAPTISLSTRGSSWRPIGVSWPSFRAR